VSEMIRFARTGIGAKLLSGFGTFFKAFSRGDHFKFWAPTFVSFWLAIPAFGAGLDLAIGGTFRSYPLSGVLEPELGYGMILWGDESASPWYGYLRPKIEGATAATYNSGAVSLELFPLSFLGGRAGGESIQNDNEYSAYDCEIYGCLGRYYRTFAEAELSLGAGPVFMQARWRRERWTQKNAQAGDFLEPTSGVVLDGTGDSQTVYIGMLGFKFSENWSVLGVVRYAESEGLEGWSRMPYGVIRYTSGNFQIGVGGGQFESSLKSKDATALGFFRWDFWPSVAIK
jgi:hypothetical protein